MLRSLTIENFRCFSRLDIENIGRINLLVGTNNSGKTSILEAIQLLTSQSPFEPLQDLMLHRGEYIVNDETSGQAELDIRHLFCGHSLDIGSTFLISSNNDSDTTIFSATVISPSQQKSFFKAEDLPNIAVKILKEEEDKFLPETVILPLSFVGGLPLAELKSIRKDLKKSQFKVRFITSSSLSREETVELFEQIVLTPEEDILIEALQTIEPGIQRIASIGAASRRYSSSRSGFVIKLSNSEEPIPIGSMGDGIWRILGLTLALVNAKNGVLLVDEIDTGFHFSVMTKMWKLVWETAKRLNVQVFATTHNSDCWTSLAEIANRAVPSEDGIIIHRIERGKPHSIVFNERQIAIAAERGIEVR